VQGNQLKEILKLFYSTGSSAFPVIQILENGQKQFIGILKRTDLDRECSDLNRTKSEIHKIPEYLLTSDSDYTLFKSYFKSHEKIPVLSEEGFLHEEWSETELLIEISKIPKDSDKETPFEKEKIKEVKIDDSQSADFWLAKLILSGISNPLYASGLKGETLFYNQSFELNVLNHPFFNQSIVNLELYFLEMIRDTLGKNASKGLPTEKFIAAPVHLPFIIDITTLEDQKKVIGYLFLFRNSEKIIDEISTLACDSKNYKNVLDGVESGIILKTLEKNKLNISHTAQELNLKRSTLQNRIKLLDLEKVIQEKRLYSDSTSPSLKNKKIESRDNLKNNDLKTVKKEKSTRKKKKSSSVKKTIKKKSTRSK